MTRGEWAEFSVAVPLLVTARLGTIGPKAERIWAAGRVARRLAEPRMARRGGL